VPFLVAMLVAVGVLRASSALEALLYFGSVGVKKTRHAVGCALASEVAGVIAAIFVTYLFFG